MSLLSEYKPTEIGVVLPYYIKEDVMAIARSTDGGTDSGKKLKKLPVLKIKKKVKPMITGNSIITTHEKNKVSKPTVEWRNSFGGKPDDDSALGHLMYNDKNTAGAIIPKKNAVTKRLLTKPIFKKGEMSESIPKMPRYTDSRMKSLPFDGVSKPQATMLDPKKTILVPKNYDWFKEKVDPIDATRYKGKNSLKEIQKLIKAKTKKKSKFI